MLAVGIGTVLLVQPCAADDQSRDEPEWPQESAAKNTQPVKDADDKSSAARGREKDAPARNTENKLGGPLVKDIAQDQKAIWTSPARLRWQDADWLVPLGGVTAALMSADRSSMQQINLSPTIVKRSTDFSNYGVGALVGAGGGLYLWGRMTGDDHKRETGILSGEAAVNALALTSVLQRMLGRERPGVDNARGRFLQGGTSFPSDHAATAWSVASVIAHEYPGPLTKVLAYGLASAVSASRVSGKQHFPSDVLVGSAIGWFVGQQVYRAHHDPELGGGSWETASDVGDAGSEPQRSSRGSPYVPLDSWVYPAFERLAALGYVKTEMLGMRPWTRIECARLVEEAGELVGEQESELPEPTRLYHALREEFAQDAMLLSGEQDRSLRVESLYTRGTQISGTPLRDSYHFGQTLINDFGRPYAEGTNLVSGFSGWAGVGRFAVYVRGEYQHSPSVPTYSQDVRNLIAQVDENPVQPAQPVPTTNQFTLLDTYVLMNLDNWELSFGKQSLWWGPDQGSSLIWSDNAEPVVMGRVARTIPAKLPSFLGVLGPVRVELFFGKLAGHQFPPCPLIHGEKISFKPTPRLEMGFSRTVVLSGVGHPLTLKNLLASYFNLQFHVTLQKGVLGVADPGDRHGAFDLSYRLANWMTVYSNLFWDDAIRRTAYNPGVYFPRIPGLPKLDLRAEVVSTDVPPDHGQHAEGRLIYWEGEYHDSYLNNGDLLGSWVGRQGFGGQVWATYWFSPRSSVQVGYRHGWINPQFIPQGGALNDVSVRADFRVRSDLSLSAFVQHEGWNVPVLSPSPKTSVTTSLQLTFYPRWGIE
jgi:hypothetical protein